LVHCEDHVTYTGRQKPRKDSGSATCEKCQALYGIRSDERKRKKLARQRAKTPVRTYIVEGTGGYKVGASRNPKIRKRKLQTGSPDKLTLLGWFPEGVTESEVLRDLNPWRHPGGGGQEWFLACPEVHQYMEDRRFERIAQ
jgi:hypothetical protein